MSGRSGTTLVELLVVITILGTLAGITAFTIGPSGSGTAQHDQEQEGRRRAVLSGTAVTLTEVADSGRAMVVRYLPDGRVIKEPVNGQ
ncbi:MAG: type II secretion system protein [Gemmatimonadales bacterium]|nr:type II secretion system protein [Gemmatimonadales bacterium]